MKKNIYLSGAMGCYPHGSEEPIIWRKKCEEYLKNKIYNSCFNIFNPTEYFEYGVHRHKSEKEIMLYELRKVKESNVILVNLKDIEKSIGTSDEILCAYLHNIPIIGFYETDRELNSSEIYSAFHPWKIEQMDRIETGKNAMHNALLYIAEYYSS